MPDGVFRGKALIRFWRPRRDFETRVYRREKGDVLGQARRRGTMTGRESAAETFDTNSGTGECQKTALITPLIRRCCSGAS